MDAAEKKVKERWQRWDSARTERVLNRRIAEYEEACREAARKRVRSQDFCFLYQCLLEELRLFDDGGTLRDRQEAEEQIATALDLLDSLGRTSISKAVKNVRRTLPDLLAYFDVAAAIVPE